MEENDINRSSFREEPEGVTVVIQALRELDDGPEIDDALARDLEADPDRLGDLLFDYADRFDGVRLLYYMTAGLIPRLDELARDLCAKEYLLLDPRKLADDALIHLFTGHLDRTRRRPFLTWAYIATRTVARHAAHNGDIPLFVAEGSSLPGERLMHELAKVSNRQTHQARRLSWLAWVEKMGINEIASETGFPLERVEWLLDSVIQQASNVIQQIGDPNERPKDATSSPEFWGTVDDTEGPNG